MTEKRDRPHYHLRRVDVGDDEMIVELRNGREITASLDVFPYCRKRWRRRRRESGL